MQVNVDSYNTTYCISPQTVRIMRDEKWETPSRKKLSKKKEWYVWARNTDKSNSNRGIIPIVIQDATTKA